jgi:predicted Zn-dependent protease
LRHPYLNPFNPDHDRLAAERVLAMKNTIVAGRDADWVLRYARQLDKRGESAKAIYYYQEGLRLNPYDRDATSRLAVLEAQVSGGLQGEAPFPAASSWAPYWTAESPIIKPLRRRIDSQLEDIEECTVVVVPVGKVSDDLLDAVGFTIRNELNLPVYVSPDSVPLPPHTRVRGLATGPQWEESVLAKAFINSVRSFPNAPVRYVLIVPADMYMEGTNYTFSTSYEWGGLVSFARFGGPDGDDPLLRRRTAKQALSALVQSFGVPKSIDRACVTSYTHSLEEFDAKGNRPNAETLRLFRKAVAGVNYDWQRYKASIGFGWGAAPKPGS